jgi:methylmalonyl-CoA mutase cobalamin-binding domain/chain
MVTEENIKMQQEKLHKAILEGDREGGVRLANEALASGTLPLVFFQEVVGPVVDDMGDRFSKLEIFLPELMRTGMIVKAIQEEVLEPAIVASGVSSDKPRAGKIVIGTCLGDIHDIGKNMVALMLQVNGFKVVDLGTNVTPRDFIDAAKREQADIIAMSTLLTTSMPFIKDTVELLEGMGLREKFAVVVGGAPITQQWVDKHHMDGFGEDAVEAVKVCQQLIETKRARES